MMVKYFMTFKKEGYDEIYNTVLVMDEINNVDDLRALEVTLNDEYFTDEEGDLVITNLTNIGGFY
ncbi:MAG: hypothetical protein ACRC68_05360 [Clostridium sp.]